MKEIIDEKKRKNDTFSKRTIFEQIEINNAQFIADNFTEYFVNVGLGFASKISESEISYGSNPLEITTTFDESPLVVDEFDKGFNLFNNNKVAESGGLHVNFITFNEDFL